VYGYNQGRLYLERIKKLDETSKLTIASKRYSFEGRASFQRECMSKHSLGKSPGQIPKESPKKARMNTQSPS
jgi:hypothetical protein